MQHVHVDLPLEISLTCANTLHILKQRRSKGIWRPGANLNFAPPPPKKKIPKK